MMRRPTTISLDIWMILRIMVITVCCCPYDTNILTYHGVDALLSVVPHTRRLEQQPSHVTHFTLFARRKKPNTNIPPSSSNNNNNNNSDGQVGQGRNWIERSFPVDITESDKVDPKKVEDYNLGIHGESWQTGSLSERMYQAIVNKSSLVQQQGGGDSNKLPYELQRALALYAMDFTAKEATKAALAQNGLEMILTEDEQDQGMWGDVDSIRIYQNDENDQSASTQLYDSWEEALDEGGWKPGQAFDFVVRQVPAKMRELSLDELLQALDPDGSLRQQAKDAGMRLPDEEIASLKDLADETVRRTEASPREAVEDEDAYAAQSSLDKRGYKPIHMSDLTNFDMNDPSHTNTLMHVMDALVSHGCILVDLTDGGKSYGPARTMANMWSVAERFFAEKEDDALPGLQTAHETGSGHAKVGFASYDGGNLQFLETRLERSSGELLPRLDDNILGPDSRRALADAFHAVARIGKDITRIAVAASTSEIVAGIPRTKAFESATKLSDELLDDGRPLPPTADIANSEGTVSMSPHRLCCYTNRNTAETTEDATTESTKEIFGAHTDSTFLTAVPVASVAGLEVFDEDADRWYRPELAARLYWEEEQREKGKDPTASVEEVDGESLPWYSRYVVMMPGEMLQLTTRSEILASVHRVVATQDRPSRLSCPILLRGRPGTIMDVDRYLGGVQGDPILDECNGMTIEEIHNAMQPTPFQ